MIENFSTFCFDSLIIDFLSWCNKLFLFCPLRWRPWIKVGRTFFKILISVVFMLSGNCQNKGSYFDASCNAGKISEKHHQILNCYEHWPPFRYNFSIFMKNGTYKKWATLLLGSFLEDLVSPLTKSYGAFYLIWCNLIRFSILTRAALVLNQIRQNLLNEVDYFTLTQHLTAKRYPFICSIY